MDDFESALEPYGDTRALAAWVGGSHAHGLAGPGSDIDMRIVIAPDPADILLDRADATIGLHDPDISIMTPVAFLKGLAKGSPNMLEALALPAGCLLLDSGLLDGLKPLAAGLATRRTVDMALGNAASNLHLLERDMDARRRRKMQAESMRLLLAAGLACADPAAPWPCRLPDDDLTELRRIREHGMDGEELARQLPAMREYAAAHRRPASNTKAVREAERMVANPLKGIILGTTASFPMDGVLSAVRMFAGDAYPMA